MSPYQSVYPVLRRIAISTSMSICLIVAGCSNSAESAMKLGALARVQFQNGQLAQARETIKQAVADRDDIVDLQLLRGRIEMAARSANNAYDAYSIALSLDSANPEALLGVAQLGLQIGRLRDSEDAADRLLALDPRQPQALLIKGLHDIIKRRYADAIAKADTMLQIEPGDEGGVILKARSLALLDRHEEAFAVVEKARGIAGDTAGTNITLLELYRLEVKGREMVPMLERLRQLTPNDHRLYIDEADTLYKLGETARAREVLRRMIVMKTLSGPDAEAATRLWDEYDPAASFDAATFREFAANAGQPARLAVARYFIDHNKPDAAEAALFGAAANDNIAGLRSRIAVIRSSADEALAQAADILSRDSTNCDALVAKAQASLAKGRADDAIVASQTAAANCPQLPAAYIALARAHQLKHNDVAVGLAFRDGFEQNPQDSAFARTYADWREQTGNGRRALAIARRLTAATPSLLSGWKLYQELCARTPDAGCSAEADAGMARARTYFGVDLRTGERPPPSLLGRLGSR
jgi:tetratricopeptide (TPR) repeat protein